jgi:metal-responsive CopG/Arc/MetJ family transcriptional regulator
MKRKGRIMIPINIRLPMTMIQQMDETQTNRSQFIRTAITKHLADDAPTVVDAPTRQLMAALSSRPDVDSTLRLLLVALLGQ